MLGMHGLVQDSVGQELLLAAGDALPIQDIQLCLTLLTKRGHPIRKELVSTHSLQAMHVNGT